MPLGNDALAESGKSIAQVGRDLGISLSTLHNWVHADGHQAVQSQASLLSEDELEELARLRAARARWPVERRSV